MAITEDTIIASGQQNFQIPFAYLEESDVQVTFNGVAPTPYTFANATTISFDTAPPNGTAVRIFRQTDVDSIRSTFFPGSAIRAQDLNDNFTQALYIAQETENAAANIGAGQIVDGSVQTAKLADSAVTSIKLANNSVITAKINNGAVTTAKLDSTLGLEAVDSTVIRTNAITTAKINGGAVTTEKLNNTAGTEAVDTAVIRNNAITTAKINGGAVTSAKLDSTAGSQAVITSVIRDGAVTTSKLDSTAGSQAITTAVVRDGAITTAKLDNTAGSQAVTTAVVRDGAITAPKLNGAQSGSAPIYGCRAWVRFDGTASGTFAGGISSVFRAAGSTTATITTTTPHGLIVGHYVYAATGVVAGVYQVQTVPTTTTFTITTGVTTALNSVSITFPVVTIRASGNVSSVMDVGVGDYLINFTTPMEDSFYNVVGCGSNTDASTGGGIFVVEDSAPTTASVRVGAFGTASASISRQDRVNLSVSIFR